MDTRLRKLAAGEFDAIILAVAGLKRLGHETQITQILDDEVMLSAAGQGALGIVRRHGDDLTLGFLEALNHVSTRVAVTAERGLLRALQAAAARCRLPEMQSRSMAFSISKR